MDMYERLNSDQKLDRTSIAETLGCSEHQCPWLAIMSKLFGYDMPDPCATEIVARVMLQNSYKTKGRKLKNVSDKS